MAEATERIKSRRTRGGSSPTQERLYTVVDASDYQEAIDAVLAIAPTTVDIVTVGGSSVTVPVRDLDADPIEDEGSIWIVSVEYGAGGSGSLNTSVAQTSLAESATDFAIGAGTRRITHSLSTELTSRAPGVASDDYNRAINVENGKVQGVDIVVPTFRWKESYELPPSFVTDAYITTLYSLVGKCNQQGWRGFGVREVLFAGATGKRQGGKNWFLDFEFWFERSVTGLEIGECTGIDKAGWDYLWVESDETSGTHGIIPKPKVVRVERVYEEADLYDLGIGT